MGIYVGNDWIVHSSRFGTTLTPMKDWYETRFAWARGPSFEGGLSTGGRGPGRGGVPPSLTARLIRS